MTDVASAIERLAGLNAKTEIWWDSSPLIYEGWRAETLAGPDGTTAEEIDRALEALL